MLYPQSNPFRQTITLPDYWDFTFDPESDGANKGWAGGFPGGRPIAVPASWNDQFEDWRDYLGNAWYQARFGLPWGWEGKRITLRFGSVNYIAEVWLNGVRLGQHEGGHLPFEFDATPHVQPENNLLVVRVDGELAPDRVPPGKVTPDALDTFGNNNAIFPHATFDFFPFCGIHRPVSLYATAPDGITDLTVVTEIDGRTGLVRVQVQRAAGDNATARFTLHGHGAEIGTETQVTGETAEVELAVPNAELWGPGSPALYDLTVELAGGEGTFDSYSLPIGIRTVAVDGDALLLNGKPIKLTGFGRHEDFPVVGRGLPAAAVIKDYALMEWVGANSFRTSHYPYSEQMMDLADRLGVLVIDETPAVGLFFREDGLDHRLAMCRQFTEELIARDKNHPSVIMWSLANEPHSKRPPAKGFFRELYDLAKSLDDTRPVTIVSFMGPGEEAFEFCDVVCMNCYNGWYSECGQLDAGLEKLSQRLDAIHERFPKPFLMTEFGADALPGWHAQPPEMFSEEYQAEMIARYIELLDSKPYSVCQHVWNLCDFKTGQGIHRVGALNLKGVFTRDRRPKMAAHRLRELWGGGEE